MIRYFQKISLLTLVSLLALSSADAQKKPLFDGKTLNGWKKIVGSAPYAIENGAIVGTMTKNSPNSFLVTEKEYGDFVLELDVKLEGAGTNSGVQTRSHY